MPSGAGASGQADAAYGRELGSQPVVLLSRPVDSRLGYEPESVFATLCPKIHAPTKTTKESVAWKKEKKQVPVDILDWTFTSIMCADSRD
jgi:hypothetical protein